MAHEYHQGKRDRQNEKRGMKKYWHESKENSGHAHKEKHMERRNNSPESYGSSNHGSGWVSEYHRGYGPYTMNDHKKDPGYKGGRMDAVKVAQHQEPWGCDCTDAMKQHESGSMNYLSDKDGIRREDSRRISGQMLPH